jgi:hypothetical protein
MGEMVPRRVWFYRASALIGPWLGSPGCRPPIWFGGDEFGRRTVVFQLPGIGCAIVAIGHPHHPEREGDDGWSH